MSAVLAELEALLARLERLRGKGAAVRRWSGPRPAGGFVKVTRAILETQQYRWPRRPDGTPSPLPLLDLQAAARLLAMTATQSQAYEFNREPRAQIVADVAAVLAKLGPDAQFVTNVEFREGGRSGWPLSKATFDSGVFGYGSEGAFIFWVEEED